MYVIGQAQGQGVWILAKFLSYVVKSISQMQPIH